MPSRRQLITTGVVGAALLASATWWMSGRRGSARRLAVFALSPSGQALFAALAPVILGSAWPGVAARSRIIQAVTIAIGQLSPSAQREIGQLIDLLTLSPTRMALAAVMPSWDEASPETIAGFLQRWRESRLGLLQSGYQALHDLVVGAWYADPEAWQAIGYSGPPSLGRTSKS